MINNHPNLSSGPETLFLSTLLNIERSQWYHLAQYGLTQSEWQSHIRDLFSSVHNRRAESEGKSRWVDKTPGYALILDFIDELYPDCQVIHVVRDPHDVIDSWRRRLGVVKAHRAVKAWPRHVLAARAFRDKQPPNRFTEIRYEDVVMDPKGVMSSLLSWLGEPWDETILDLSQSSQSGSSIPDMRQQLWQRWLGNPVGLVGPASKPRWKPVESARNSSEVSTGSVGTGRHGVNRLINAPYFLELDLRAHALVREFGYG